VVAEVFIKDSGLGAGIETVRGELGGTEVDEGGGDIAAVGVISSGGNGG
jgi:hypothetical protein